jgi:hypothetical protein
MAKSKRKKRKITRFLYLVFHILPTRFQIPKPRSIPKHRFFGIDVGFDIHTFYFAMLIKN